MAGGIFAATRAILPATMATSRSADRFVAGSMTLPPAISRSYEAGAPDAWADAAAWENADGGEGSEPAPNGILRNWGATIAADPSCVRNVRRSDCDMCPF